MSNVYTALGETPFFRVLSTIGGGTHMGPVLMVQEQSAVMAGGYKMVQVRRAEHALAAAPAACGGCGGCGG